eukprot:9146570-Pyramimonas_sp.AAC.1
MFGYPQLGSRVRYDRYPAAQRRGGPNAIGGPIARCDGECVTAFKLQRALAALDQRPCWEMGGQFGLTLLPVDMLRVGVGPIVEGQVDS